MANRVLRITVDVVVPADFDITEGEKRELIDAARGGVRAGLSERLVGSHAVVEAAKNNRNEVQGAHIHLGRSGCLVCADLYQDKKGER